MKYRIITDPWSGAGFILSEEEYRLMPTIGELPGPNGDDEYVLSCIQDMHKVMRGEMIKAYAGYDENGQKIYKDWKYASIGSGEGCTVYLSKDECVVLNLYDDTETEVDPQAFYQMMCDWEKAILRWREERIEMIIEEKKKKSFRDTFRNADYSYINTLLKRELHIVEEDAKKRGMTNKELRDILHTDVLEEIEELERQIHFLRNTYGKKQTQIDENRKQSDELKIERSKLDLKYLGEIEIDDKPIIIESSKSDKNETPSDKRSKTESKDETNNLGIKKKTR